MSPLRSLPLTALSGTTARLATVVTLLLAALGGSAPAPTLAAPAPLAPQGPCVLAVNNTSDSGGGSLRTAVGCAGAGQTVTFAGGLAGQTITLTSGMITITQSIGIDATGAPGLRIDGNNTGRIFNVTASGPVTLTAMVLQHGNAVGNGGAVLTGASSTLALSGTQFLTNTSTGSGGGLFAIGALALTNGRFQGNTSADSGGGLYAFNTLTLTGTQFLSNTSTGYGGGVYANVGVALTNGLFQGNVCTAANCQGGGLLTLSTLTLTGTEFISNTSTSNGGGAYADSAVTLTNGRFERNTCTGADCQGGGLFANNTLTLTSTEFISNTSRGGGGVSARGPATLTNGRFERNACTGSDCFGGGLIVGINPLTLSGTEFISNTSRGSGAGVYALSDVTLTNGLFQGNTCTTAGCFGGGLRASTTLILTGTQFISNTSTSGGGGARVTSAVTLTNGLFQGNTCTLAGCFGGGLLVSSTLSLTGTHFLSNSATGNGGGVFAVGAATLTNSHFQGNTCSATDCLGGGLSPQASATMLNSSFSANQAAGRGGGIGLTATAQITLANVTLSGNSAAVSGGGLYVGGTGAAQLLNVTVANNQAPAGAGLRALPGATVGVTNTLLANNTGGNCDGAIDFGTNNLEWPGTTCATAGPAAGFTTGNPALVPLALYAPGTTLTHALLNASAARDVGDPATCAGPLVNNRDQRGVVRPIDGDSLAGAVCDIGAYEAAAPDWRLFIPIVTR